MDVIKLLNTSDTRYIRYYIQCLHNRKNAEWNLDIINSYGQKDLKNMLNELINELKEKSVLSFSRFISRISDEARMNLIEVSNFDWTRSDRALYFTWNALKNRNVDLKISFRKDNKQKQELKYIIEVKEKQNIFLKYKYMDEWNKRYSHLCCNKNNNIFNYITWTFDDVESDDMLSNKVNHLGTYHTRYKTTCSENKINWIKANDTEQIDWLYNYLTQKSDFSFITEPTDYIQRYNTVICQLDLICDYYSSDLEVWDYFLKSVKKAWSTQSDRKKKGKVEIKLDKESVKMLREVVGHGATDTMLKKKVKELIKIRHEADKEARKNHVIELDL